MRHKVLTRRHIRDSRGRFTGIYRWDDEDSGIDIKGLGHIEYPKTFCAMQMCVLLLTYLIMS
jgi:hypothetical protein